MTLGITTQFRRFATVGLISNGLLYLMYLFLSWVGLGHKTAMTLIYVLGVLQTFFFNKKWSFEHRGAVAQSMTRYVAAYLSGYLINFLALLILVDQMGAPHELVQAVMIICLAVAFFFLQRNWIFKQDDEPQSQHTL